MSDMPSSDVVAAFGRLMDLHREIGSRVPDHLRPPLPQRDLAAASLALGFDLHPEVQALYRVADGVEARRWFQQPRVPPRVVPRVEFPALQLSVEAATGFRTTAADLDETGDMWRESWFPVLSISPDEVIVVDCATATGEVWLVRWEADETRPAAPDLATFFDRAADRMREAGVVAGDGGYSLEIPASGADVAYY